MKDSINIGCPEYSGRFKPSCNGRQNLLYFRCTYWYRQLFRIALSLWKYEGLPDSINRDAMTLRLLTRGFVICQRIASNKLLFWKKDIYALDAAVSGLDPYGFPRFSQINNMFLGSKSGVIGKDSALIRANRLAEPIVDALNHYAEMLAQCDIGIIVNLTNLNSTRMFKAADDKEAQAFRLMTDLATAGEPAVLLRDSIFDDENNSFLMLNENVKYLVHDYIQDKIAIKSEFLATFGVESLPTEKGGNIITPEIKINMRDAEINRSYWIEPQQEGFDSAYNAGILDEKVTVTLREPDISELLKLDANGDGNISEKEIEKNGTEQSEQQS